MISRKNLMNQHLKGCMYGLAIGDALGAAVEFRRPGEFAPVTGYRGLGPHGLDAGEWTDDTSMALALADSIGQVGWDLADQSQRYVNWWQEGHYSVNGWCFDIGGTTKSGLSDFIETKIPHARHDVYSQGNGSIMRLAPVFVKYAPLGDLPAKCKESSVTTHSHPNCVKACEFLGLFLEGLTIERLGKQRALEDALFDIGECDVQKALESKRDIVGSGYVIDSLYAATWAFMSSNSFEEAVLKAVNLGNDSDTTGAVCGQMAGAFWGYDRIPDHLIDGLAKKEMIDLYLNPLLE